MITPLTDVQNLARDTIKAGATGALTYFTNDLVVSEDGNQKKVYEAALASRGIAYVVDLPYQAELLKRAAHLTLAYAHFMVLIKINPAQNPSGANVNALEAIKYVKAALLGYNSASNSEDDNFESGEIPFHLLNYDEGLIEYALAFRKLVALSSS